MAGDSKPAATPHEAAKETRVTARVKLPILRMVLTLDLNNPKTGHKVEFEGPWNGRMVAVARSLVGRGYALHIKRLRDTLEADKRAVTSTPPEAAKPEEVVHV